MKKKMKAGKIAGFILLGLGAIALFTFLVMSLWNAVLVPVLHVGAVSFWQAAGILLLSKILFGGFKGGGGWRGRGGPWKHEMRAKWENMSAEEKEQMKQEWRQRCSRWKGGRHDYNNATATGNETAEKQ